jgi:iron complex outermembrane receptor protein
LGAAVHWLVSLCAIELAIGSQSSSALADPVEPVPTPIPQAVPAKLRPPSAQRVKPSDPAPQIIVTGSRIPRSNLTAISPVTIVNGEEFKLQGASNIDEVLNRLPQVNPSEGEFVSAGATGLATVDLRGLGSVRTLVLVNGKRLLPGDPRFPVPDLNSIPAPLIQRVEVLTGGAAAVYGSDAVAGVVNFILDTKLEGFRIDGNVSAYQHDNRDRFAQGLLDQRQLAYPKGSVVDGWRENVSAAFARSFVDNRGHIELYAGYRHIAALTQDRRDYSACAITAVIVSKRPTSTLECGGNLFSYPGNFFDNLGNTYQVTFGRTFEPGFNRFNITPWNFYQRPDRRYTAGGFATFDFSDAVQAYAEVMAMRDRSVAQTSPSGDVSNTQTINCDNPLMSAQQRSLICRNGNFVGQTPVFDTSGNLIQVLETPAPFIDPVTGTTYSRGWLLVSRRSIESGAIQDDLRHRSIRLVGGLKGDLGRGVTYDASYVFGQVGFDEQLRNILSISRLNRALDVVADPSTGQPICRSVLIARVLGASAAGADANCVPWDIFAPGQVSTRSVGYLTVPLSAAGSFEQRIANANATIELDRWGITSPWSSEGAAINVGAEHRNDVADFKPDPLVQLGDIAGFTPQVYPVRGSVSASEIFAEARIPLVTDRLVRRLAFEGGFRQSWYDNGASKFSVGAYKFALDLTAVTGLRLRASLQRANRAPNVQELFAPAQPGSFDDDPCAGVVPDASQAQCALTGVIPSQYGHVIANRAFGYNSIIGGNVDLQPELSTTRTVGVVLEPAALRGFNATADWWDIRLNGAIAEIGGQTIIDDCIATADPAFCSRIHRDANGSLWLGNGYVDDRQANIGGLHVRGIDVGADYSARLGRLGSANVEFRGSYVLRWITDNGGLSVPYDCVGLFGDPCEIHPRWRHSARATWNTRVGPTLSVQWRHTSGMTLAALDPKFNLTNDVSTADTKLSAQNYFDVTTMLSVHNGPELRLGVNNIFDRKPPLIVRNTAAGGGPVNGNTYPEWYDALGRYIFASVTINFRP